MRTLALVTVGTILISGISIFFIFDFSIETYLMCLWGLQGCDPEAMGFFKRPYRKPWVVEDEV